MYCSQCGTNNVDTARQCVSCGGTMGVATPTPPPFATQTQSGKAVASMVCSIVGLIACLFIGQIIGLILGYSAKNEIQASQGRLTGEGFATAGIVIGWVGLGIDILLVLVYVFIFAAAAAF